MQKHEYTISHASVSSLEPSLLPRSALQKSIIYLGIFFQATLPEVYSIRSLSKSKALLPRVNVVDDLFTTSCAHSSGTALNLS